MGDKRREVERERGREGEVCGGVEQTKRTCSKPVSSHVVCTFLRPPAMMAVDFPPALYCGRKGAKNQRKRKK
eukprot:3520684-Rhodomonas_salina.2